MKQRATLLGLLLLSLAINAQVKTIVYDGTHGAIQTFYRDTIRTGNIVKNSPADLAGMKPRDRVIMIDGIDVTHQGAVVLDKYLYGAAGEALTLSVLRRGKDSLLKFHLTREYDLSHGRQCKYEYLIDSSGEWTIEDILSDSINGLFSLPIEKKILINRVEEKSLAADAGLKAGDRIVSLMDELSNPLSDLDEISFRRIEDTSLTVLRDSLLIDFHFDKNEDPLASLVSQFSADKHQKHTWIRIRLENRIAEDRTYLLFARPDDSVNLYEVRDEVILSEKICGRLVAHENKDFNFKDQNPFKIQLRKGQTQTFYLKLFKFEENLSERPEVYFENYGYISQLDRAERLLLGILWGMMLIFGIYYLILFIYVRDWTYLFYSAFIFCLIILLLDVSGYVSEFLDQKHLRGFDSLILLIAASMILFLMFGISYLGLHKHQRTWYRILLYSQAGIGLLFIIFALLLFFPDAVSFDLMFIISILVAVVVLFAPLAPIVPTIMRIRQGYKPAWHFLLANLILLVSIWIFAIAGSFSFYNESVHPHSTIGQVVFKNASLHMAAVMQIILFAFGLGRRIRTAEKEREAAQARIIEQLKENEKLKDKVNRELEEKVKERTREISQQKEEIETQRDELEAQKNMLLEQKQEITDSINYARKIQAAVLPSEELLTEILPEHFVLFKPKDIVSGDFYWIRRIKNFSVIVAADCTGHGVPGAFMSMLGMSMLNELVSRSRLDTAGEILDRLRKKVKDTLRQEGKMEEQKDGMDMSIALIDHESEEIQYAGAFNPLYLIRSKHKKLVKTLEDQVSMESEQHVLIEVKGDRQPIAVYANETEFTTHTLKLEDMDSLYMFSDGYADQMGGPKGKKFMARKFKELLLSIREEPMDRQKEILDRTIEDWKSGVDQLDDILIFGIGWVSRGLAISGSA